MDLFDILASNQRVVVFSNWETRSLFTWNQEDILTWWRPKVRIHKVDYPKGQHDPNDWEEIFSKTLEVPPKTFEEAREQAKLWLGPPF